jgi:hypothetical protein
LLSSRAIDDDVEGAAGHVAPDIVTPKARRQCLDAALSNFASCRVTYSSAVHPMRQLIRRLNPYWFEFHHNSQELAAFLRQDIFVK